MYMSEGKIIAKSDAWKIKKEQIEQPGLLEDTVIRECVVKLFVNGNQEILVCSHAQLEELIVGHLFCQGQIKEAADLVIDSMEETEDGVCIYATIGDKQPLETNRGKDLSAYEKNLANQDKCIRFPMTPASVMRLSEEMLTECELFQQTGAFHSCLLCSNDEKYKIVCIDMGRHNAIDKAIGAAKKAGVDLKKCTLFTTGRVPTDMMMKAVTAQIPMLVSRGAVTEQSILLAKKYGIILCGFSRGQRMNVYTCYDSLYDS